MLFTLVFLLILIGVVVLVAGGIVSQKKVYDETLKVYRKIGEKRNGKISRLPFKLGALDSLEIPIEGGSLYFNIAPKGINFFAVSPQLENYMPFWIVDAKTIRPGSFKIGNPEFDQKFRVWKGPKEQGLLQSKFNQDCQKALLDVKEEVVKRAVNIFVELIHTTPRTDTLSLKIDNYLINTMPFKAELDDLSRYEAILDKCIKVYQAFRQSGRQ